MKEDYVALGLILAGVGLFAWMQPKTDAKDHIIQQQQRQIEQLQSEQRGMERALGLAK